MRALDRFVVDTNVFVSAIALPRSVPRHAVDKALARGLLLFSEATLGELSEVLFRSKFDHYSSVEARTLFLVQLKRASESVRILQTVRECRDPKDDKFLEVALNGRADLIITGDSDLLALHPWREIGILSPTEYVSGE
ncbi:MAG TPA: putative toxin-antitoxin system toxin component, PIN family [Terriglobales bacterium]|jgi:putative PIN family toxin of toxin-antitoxin system|nr:putative toxin-antitoxin system toxin component, PIN family [Terriglobales bacterium]